MKTAYPCPVVFGDSDKIIASSAIARLASPLITSAFPDITQSAIVITDVDTYREMVLIFDQSMVYVWLPKRSDATQSFSLPTPNNQVTFYEEGGWRKMLVDATEYAQRLNKTQVFVFGSKDIVKKMLPFSYDVLHITIQELKLRQSFENDAYVFKLPEDFVETEHRVTKKAAYIVGPLLEVNYGRNQPPKSISDMWREYSERTE
jgi:dihydrofolate reductase